MSFGSARAASIYATTPNQRRLDSVAQAPRIVPAYLRIKCPLVDSPDDPFIDVARLVEVLGVEQARRIAMKFADHIEETGLWQEDFSGAHPLVRDYIAHADPDELEALYFSVYPLLDDPSEVQLLRAAGFDGAIYGGSGETALEPEYRVFSVDQVLPAIEAGWPLRSQEQPRTPAPADPVRLPVPMSTVKKVREVALEVQDQYFVDRREAARAAVVQRGLEAQARGAGGPNAAPDDPQNDVSLQNEEGAERSIRQLA